MQIKRQGFGGSPVKGKGDIFQVTEKESTNNSLCCIIFTRKHKFEKKTLALVIDMHVI